MTTILFETITAAQKAHDTLQSMIDVSIDCNAIIYNETDEEAVRWLIQDSYCQSDDRERYVYPKPIFILLVDEDPNFLILLTSDYIDYKELQIFTARSEEEGWQTYCSFKPNIIVSRIAIKATEWGCKLFQRIRENDPDRPLIFLSSQLDELSSAQHRAGLAELILTIKELEYEASDTCLREV